MRRDYAVFMSECGTKTQLIPHDPYTPAAVDIDGNPMRRLHVFRNKTYEEAVAACNTLLDVC
jgi:hypothetical protein